MVKLWGVLRYVKETVSFGLSYNAGIEGDRELEAYGDADRACDRKNIVSTTKFVVGCAGAALNWAAKYKRLSQSQERGPSMWCCPRHV